MYRILVVEDDDIIRKGLLKIISKMDMPIENLFEAENGLQALNLIDEAKPDIVITDIKMPSMSGLDLIRQVKAINGNIKFIIISGYNEFSFAQQAVNLNVSEYLLKPIKKDKLHTSLLKIFDHLNKEKKAAEQNSIKEMKFKNYKSIVLRAILQGYYKPDTISSAISETGIDFNREGFVVISIYCSSKQDTAKEFLQKFIIQENICTSYLSKYNHLLCLLNISNIEFQQLGQAISDTAHDYAVRQKLNIYTGVSQWTDKVSILHELVQQSEDSLDYRVIDNMNYMFLYTDIKKFSIQKSALNIYYEAILNAINIKSIKDISTGFNQLIDHQQANSITPKMLKDSIEELWICYLLPNYKSKINSRLDIEGLYQSCQSLCDFKIKVKQLLLDIIKCEEVIESNNFNVKINAAIKYINNNYSKDLSLDEVAGYIKINTSYFSSIFKKNTGMNFINYLNKVRIEKSKTLLSNPQYKVYEIAEMVGFCDEKYYYKVFKSHTGITPNQYRDTSSNH